MEKEMPKCIKKHCKHLMHTRNGTVLGDHFQRIEVKNETLVINYYCEDCFNKIEVKE